MDAKKIGLSVLDCRPIKKATGYAAGTTLMGIAFGILIVVRLPYLGTTLYAIAGGVGIVGAVIANVNFYALKYRYQIADTQRYTVVEKSTQDEGD